MGLYAHWCRRLAPDAHCVTLLDLPNGPEQQERLVMEPIFGKLVDGSRLGGGIKSGAHRDPARSDELAAPLREAARILIRNGAQIVLAACTEIPLVLGRDRVDETLLLDPMEVAAEEAVAIALGNAELPSESPDTA